MPQPSDSMDLMPDEEPLEDGSLDDEPLREVETSGEPEIAAEEDDSDEA